MTAALEGNEWSAARPGRTLLPRKYPISILQEAGWASGPVWSRGVALLFLDRATRRGWLVSSTPWQHFTPGKYPVPILQEAGFASEPVWTGGKSHPHRDLILDRPARSTYIILIIVKGSTAHFVTQQQWKGSTLLHFCGNPEHNDNIDSYMCAKSSKNGTYCCISMATMVMPTCYNAMLYVHRLCCSRLKKLAMFHCAYLCLLCVILEYCAA